MTPLAKNKGYWLLNMRQFKKDFLTRSFIFLTMLCGHLTADAQVNANSTNSPADTFRIIEIIRGQSLREKSLDSSTLLETIAGNVMLREGLTLFYCDSATINRKTNIMEAFGNIHINQQDSIHTYAQYLKYIGSERIAYLRKNVKLTDRKGTLTTNDLEYNLATSIAKYQHGGKVVNGKTVLTSNEGVYYAETKDVHFSDKVHLIDPKYDIRNDSLLYNTETQVATFVSPTVIKSKNGGDIFTNNGYYDLKNGKAFFGNRSVIKDSTRTYIADNSAYDEESGIAQLEGNAVVKDSVNGYTVLGNQIFLNKNDNSFLATRKPVLIFKGDGKDSTFISADTLFSGIEKKSPSGAVKLTTTDTLKKTMVIQAGDSILKAPKPADTSRNKNGVMAKTADTSIRYFLAFHHVRIFNDSLQSVCDSLFYSTEDSVFRLYRDPLVFSNHSQISGDTIYLYTENRKSKRLQVFDNALIINKANEQMYNQVAGRTINGYFTNGNLEYMRVKGSPAESIFYPQDDDSAYIGMNRSKGDVIDIFIADKEIKKVKFINDVDGTMYPIKQVPADKKYLKQFNWQDKRRPKNKLELFE